MKHTWKRLLAVLLAVSVLLTLALPGFAVNDEDKPEVTWEKIETTQRRSHVGTGVDLTREPAHADDEIVRVSIILDEASTLDKGFSTRNIADNPSAMSYRAQLKAQQDTMAQRISDEILGGDKLDVVWNITLAANIISARVPYGKLDAIRALDGVKSVVLEAQYEADTTKDEGDQPNMYRSTTQTGSDKVWARGITGAGSRVAVIDTGVEHNHISFSGAGLEYSLKLNAEEKGMSYDEYIASLNLLTAAEVAQKKDELNVNFTIDPDTTYRSTKVPFAFNYVDLDYEVTHRTDSQGNHGSHVAGIDAANKYVPDGDSFKEGVSGRNMVRGQSYDAQIINMKVFGKNGGAFDSDYMVAIEDAIILNADSINLSLGSASPGMATSPEYQSILDSLTQSDSVVCISMGNSYSWSQYSGTNPIYADDVNYYTGGSPGSFANAFTVASVGGANYNANGRYSMSSFSSWGVPSDLSLKPEIAAPGGSILSVNGNNTTGYTSMSGTSMASPQVAGITGLVAQYIRESGLAEKTGLSPRQLAQSLIMSTAVPIHMTNNGYIYYPILQQGAGMARTDKATTSKTYILVDPESLPATAPLSAKSNVADGKVKVELGDDVNYNGAYSFAYTINNLTDKPVTYELDADFFTQNITGSGLNIKRAATIVMLDDLTTWTVNGKPLSASDLGLPDLTGDNAANAADAQAILDLDAGNIEALAANADKADIDGDGDVDSYDAYLYLQKIKESAENRVIVPANGSVKIGVSFNLKDSIDKYNHNGNYVEGYVISKEITDDGSEGVDHTIPVLGYYGSWTDPSMFNKGSYLEYKFGGETRTPYLTRAMAASDLKQLQTFLLRYAGQEFGYPIGGNPVIEEDYYDENRNAIATAFGDEINTFHYSALRNSGATRFSVWVDGQSEPLDEIITGPVFGAYYNVNQGVWGNTNAKPDLNYFVPDSVPNNTKLTLSFELAPEYYIDAEGNVNWDALHDGARKTLPITVDNEEPEIKAISIATNDVDGTRSLYLTATDNQYIAAIFIYDEAGNELLAKGSDPSAKPGDPYTLSCPIDNAGTKYRVEVYDYAMNVGTYRINLNKFELIDPQVSITLDKDDFEIIGKNSQQINAIVEPWGVDDAVTWSSSNPEVATVNGRGMVTGVEAGTTVITATSVKYGVSASVTVTVRFIDKTLNAVVCDENGAAYVIEFDSRTLPTYRTLHEEPLSDWVYETAVDRDGTVFVSTYDGSSQSPLYKLNLETFELERISTGTSRVYFSDIDTVGDTLYNQGWLVGVYNNNFMTISKTTGARVNNIALNSYTGGSAMVGITFFKTVEDADHFLIQCANGTVFELAVKLDNGSAVVDSMTQVFDFGAVSDYNSWQDLYYDGVNLFWSRIDYGLSRVDIIMAENYGDAEKETKIVKLGSFAVDVWPVGGLFELSKVPGYTPPADPEPTDPGSTNALSADAPEGIGSGTSVNITADDINTNGKFTITIPETAELISVDTSAHKSVRTYDGTVTLSYAFDEAIAKDEIIATLTFTGESEGDVTVATNERNNDHPDEEPMVIHLTPVATEDPVFGQPVWSWAEDNSMAVATFTTRDGQTVEKETADISIERTEPTHTEPGKIVYTATVEFQGETYTDTKTDILPALGHTFGEPEWTWAEDLSMATATFTCADDEASQTVNATLTKEEFAASCTGAGQTKIIATATFEDKTYTDSRIITMDALGHDWDEGAITTEPDCTNAGVKTFTCARCGETRTEAVSATGHTPEDVAAVAPTCTEAGTTAGKKCSVCGAIIEGVEFVKPTGHTAETVPGKAATCTETGLTDGAKCSVCGEILIAQTETPKAAHTPTEIPAIAATCTTPGKTAGIKCAVCGEILSAPTETAKAPHTAVAIPAVAATCTEAGLTAGSMCAVCGEILAKPEAVPALGHAWDDGKTIAPATCTGEGVKLFTCRQCGETRTEAISATGHKPTDVAAIEATCTASGKTAGKICSICGAIIEGIEDIPAKGHTVVIDEAIAPTLTSEGKTAGAHCSVCGEILVAQETIAKLDATELNAILAGAEAIDTDKFTDESVEALNKAIEAAKAALTEPTTQEILDKAAEDLSNAVKALTEKPEPTPVPTPTPTPTPTPAPFRFDDVQDEGAYFFDPVYWAYENGITAGTTETTFGPNESCTRGQVVTFLWRAAKQPEPKTSDNPFTDVKEGDYFYKAVLWAVEKGITKGTSDTEFSPADTCTRGQIVTFLYRNAGEPDVKATESEFSDVKTDDYFFAPIAWAVENQITQGIGDGKFGPNDTCTRAQVVTFLYRDLAE